jgi:hypothetical protein
VTNTGPIATSVGVTDVPLIGSAPGTPAGNAGTNGLAWTIDAIGSDPGCAITANALSCSFGTLVPGAMRHVHITAPAVARSSPGSRNDNCGQRVDNSASVTIGDGSSRRSPTVSVDIACVPTTAAGTLTIYKYSDNNGNGRQDAGEATLGGWTFEIRNDLTGQTRTATTGSTGSAVVTDLEFGQYTVREIACTSPCDFTKWRPVSYIVGSVGISAASSTGSAQITITSAQESIAFGNRLPQLPSTSTGGDVTDHNSTDIGALAGIIGGIFLLMAGRRRRMAAVRSR